MFRVSSIYQHNVRVNLDMNLTNCETVLQCRAVLAGVNAQVGTRCGDCYLDIVPRFCCAGCHCAMPSGEDESKLKDALRFHPAAGNVRHGAGVA